MQLNSRRLQMLDGFRDPVRRAQKLVAAGSTLSAELGRIIEAIQRNSLWRERSSATGKQFASLPEFITARQPYGLGVCSQEAMDDLGTVLHKCGLHGVWKELLEATTRSRGRPKHILAGSENMLPTFRLPTSHTARAKQVMLLAKHHPGIFADLEARELTLADAVQRAGILGPRQRGALRFGVYDPIRAQTLSTGAKSKLLREVFNAMGLEAQCHLLANVIGPATDQPALAQRWRSSATRVTAQDRALK